MKKTVYLVLALCLMKSIVLFASDTGELAPSADSLRPKAGRSNEILVNETISDLKAKVSELERRVNDMDKDRRFDQDRLRQLDRDVSELKRKF